MMQVPDPHNNENTYPVCMLILSLKALENPVIDVMITQEDTTHMSQTKTWLQMCKATKNISKAKNAGFAPEPDDTDDMDQGELMEMSQNLHGT